MWTDIFIHYIVFILEALTIAVFIGLIVMFGLSLLNTGREQGKLKIIDLSEHYQQNTEILRDFHLSEAELKQAAKLKKKAEKAKLKSEKQQLKNGGHLDKPVSPHLYVLRFKGDIQASETDGLREEINAILAVADPAIDEVLLCLESAGGVVHGYGLAASQLHRLKQKGIKLTVAVDKIAASGGYMMACVANKIVSAPFAILGSIGVVAQIPNVHRLLKKNDIDVELMTAGEYKRTMTVFGENTEKGRQKFQQDLDQTHILFKNFVAENRPVVDMQQVATGEHWFGQQALELKLVDEIATSDDLILQAIKDKKVLEISYQRKKSLIQKLGKQAEESTDNLLLRWLKRNDHNLL